MWEQVDDTETMLEKLKRARLRATPQRIAIVQALSDNNGWLDHPTAQELFMYVNGKYPSLSYATVYNTLDALAKAGLCGILRTGNAARFDPNTSPHHHAVCTRCGKVQDLSTETLAPNAAVIRKLAGTAPGFSVKSVERIYRGLCSRCNTRTRKRR